MEARYSISKPAHVRIVPVYKYAVGGVRAHALSDTQGSDRINPCPGHLLLTERKEQAP